MFIDLQGGHEEDVTLEELFAKFDGEWSTGKAFRRSLVEASQNRRFNIVQLV